MNSREKIKEAYKKLRCFDNPLLRDIADTLERSYTDIFGKGITEIINDVALQENVQVEDIVSDSRNEHLVYCRHLISKRAIDDYTLMEIAEALHRSDHTTILHLLKYYHVPTKFQ